MAANLGEAIIMLGMNAKKVVSGLADIKGKFKDFGEEISSMGNKFIVAGTAINTGVTGVAIKALSSFASVEKEWVKLNTTMVDSQWELKGISNLINDIALSSKFGEEDLIPVVRRLIGFGMNTKASLEPVLKSILQMSRVLDTDLNTAMNLVISGAENFTDDLDKNKYSAESLTKIIKDLSDVQSVSRLGAEDLGMVMTFLGSQISELGLSSRDVLTALAAMTKSMGSPRRASMMLRQSIQELIELPMKKEFNDVIVPGLKKVGMTADDINPKIVGVGQAFYDFYTAFHKNAEAQKLLGAGMRAVVLVGRDEADAYNVAANAMEHQQTVAQKDAATLETLNEKWLKFKNTMSNFWEALGKAIWGVNLAEALERVRLKIVEVIGWIDRNPEVIKRWIDNLLKLGTTLVVVGFALKGLGLAIQVITSLLSPAGLVMVAGMAVLYSWLLRNKGEAKNMGDWLKYAWGQLKSGDVMGALKTLDSMLATFFPKIYMFKANLVDAFTRVGSLMFTNPELARKDSNPVVVWISNAMLSLQKFGDWVTNVGWPLIEYLTNPDNWAAWGKAIKDTWTNDIKPVLKAIGDAMVSITENIGPIVESIRAIASIFPTPVKKLKETAGKIGTAFATPIGEGKGEAVLNAAESIISNPLVNPVEALKVPVGGMIEKLGGLFGFGPTAMNEKTIKLSTPAETELVASGANLVAVLKVTPEFAELQREMFEGFMSSPALST